MCFCLCVYVCVHVSASLLCDCVSHVVCDRYVRMLFTNRYGSHLVDKIIQVCSVVVAVVARCSIIAVGHLIFVCVHRAVCLSFCCFPLNFSVAVGVESSLAPSIALVFCGCCCSIILVGNLIVCLCQARCRARLSAGCQLPFYLCNFSGP